MSYPKDSAFPVQRQTREDGEVLTYAEAGLNKREYFAAMAMQGMLANASYLAAASKVATEDRITAVDSLSRAAVQHADALLAELAK